MPEREAQVRGYDQPVGTPEGDGTRLEGTGITVAGRRLARILHEA